MRGLRLDADAPEEIYAGAPALFGAVLANTQALADLVLDHARAAHAGRADALHLSAAARGRARPAADVGRDLAGPRAPAPGRGAADHALPVRALPQGEPRHARPGGARLSRGAADLARDRFSASWAPAPRRCAGAGGATTCTTCAPTGAGDDPRLIHWRSSAKVESLLVREMEAETTEDTRLVLSGRGDGDAARLEAALSEAASIAAHLARAGAGIELTGAGLFVPLGRGPEQARRILTELALYDPRAPSGRRGRARFRWPRPALAARSARGARLNVRAARAPSHRPTCSSAPASPRSPWRDCWARSAGPSWRSRSIGSWVIDQVRDRMPVRPILRLGARRGRGRRDRGRPALPRRRASSTAWSISCSS